MLTISLKRHEVATSSLRTTASLAAALILSAAVLTSLSASVVDAFQPTCRRHRHISTLTSTSSTQLGRAKRRNDYIVPKKSNGENNKSILTLYSSIGGGSDNRPPPPPSDDNNGGMGDLGDFLDPMRKQDSENLKRAREFMSERSLPLSFDTDFNHDDDDDDNDDDDYNELDGEDEAAVIPTVDTTSAAASTLTSSTSKYNNSASSSALFGTQEGSNSSDLLANNPYMQVVSKISPSEVIAKFTSTADPRVQEAVRTTIRHDMYYHRTTSCKFGTGEKFLSQKRVW
jgi:hypothetical protein